MSAYPDGAARGRRSPLWLLFYAALTILCVFAIRRALAASSLETIVAALRHVEGWRIAASIACVAGVFASILAMERLSLSGVQTSSRPPPVAAFVVNAVALGAGFGMLSGGALRARLYAPAGVDAAAAFYVASSVTLMSVLGGVVVAALGVTLIPQAMGIALYWRWVGVVALSALAVLALLASMRSRSLHLFGRSLALPTAPMFLAGLAFGALDWLLSAGALYVLLPEARWTDAPAFAALFTSVHLTAMATGAPNGLGVFDAIMMTVLGHRVGVAELSAALIVYRLTALLLPVGLGLVGLAMLETRRSRRTPVRRTANGALAHWLLQGWIGHGLRPHATTPVAKGDLFARAASTPATPLHALVGDGPVLILAPHPDDDVLGCGGLIASCAGASIPVRITYLTDGRRSHLGSSHWPGARLAATRRDEAANAAQALGLGPESLQFLAFADTTLLFDRAAQRRAASALAQLAGQHPFSSIFAPWVHDPHPDHVAVALLARRLAAASGARLLSYPIWGRFLPDRLALRDRPWRAVRLDVRDRLAAKRAAIAAHRSQMTPLIDDAVVTLRPAASVQDAFLSGDEVFFE